MNAIQEVREQYKQAARTYIEHAYFKENPAQSTNFFQGRMSGLAVALSCLGVTSDEIREMYNACEEETRDEQEQEEDIYECEHCNATFSKSEILYREYGGEIGGISFCPRCKEETKLICVSDLVERNLEREELDAIERPASQARVEAEQ